MIRIITDSTCELDKKQQEQLGITVVPLKVLFGTEEYLDGVDLTTEAFYEKLVASHELPTTTQVNPEQFRKVFEQYAKDGDEVIAILLSSKLSGTYQSAVIAKGMVASEKIHLIDSQNVTLGLGLLVIEAARLRNQGCNVQQIIDEIERLKSKVRLLAPIDTLKYLQKGGRVSGAAAVIGTALGIKPILEVSDGLIHMKDKVRGQKKLQKYLAEYVNHHQPSKKHAVVLAHSMAEELLEETMQLVTEKITENEKYIVNISSTVGAHIGPGAVGIAYIEE